MNSTKYRQTVYLPMIDMAATGRNIARLRREAGLTVRQMQDVFGFSTPQAIYKWQRGESLPTVDNLFALSRLFETSVDHILTGDTEESACSPLVVC